MYVVLADVVVALHLAYLAAIPLGGLAVARWPRLLGPHLACIAVGLASITVGFDCPLTSWEDALRRRGGQRPSREGFVAHYLAGTVYPHGYEWAVQALFGACIVATYALVLTRRGTRRT